MKSKRYASHGVNLGFDVFWRSVNIYMYTNFVVNLSLIPTAFRDEVPCLARPLVPRVVLSRRYIRWWPRSAPDRRGGNKWFSGHRLSSKKNNQANSNCFVLFFPFLSLSCVLYSTHSTHFNRQFSQPSGRVWSAVALRLKVWYIYTMSVSRVSVLD